jgi:hypothetical protein
MLRIGDGRYPIVLPGWRDPRLHVSGVVMSILVIGIATLGFGVSVPQVLSALVTAIIIDTAWTFRHTGKLVWPASGLNTATGIALILRIVGTGGGDYWSWRGWYVYALVVAGALLSKYFIRYRGGHVFNPSNIALVLVFLLLGSNRVEPLDFWWAPFGGRMVVVYAIILTGGILTLSRLKLLLMPLAFWFGLVAGLGLLSGSGHCITARWALQPVCGSQFWWVVITSPEMLFFLFFMITDPKTIPRGRLSRVVFAVCIAVIATLLIAPQTTEFGAKVGLLAALTLMSPLRWLLDRWFPELSPQRSRLAEFVDRLATSAGAGLGRPRTFLRGALGGAAMAGIALLIVAFGAPARQPAQATPVAEPTSVAVEVDPATVPAPTVADEVFALNSDIDADALAVMLAEDLATEAEAMRRGESEMLLAADFGTRLVKMQERMAQSVATGERIASQYSFDSLHLHTVLAAGGQGTDLAFDAAGTVETVTYDADGNELGSESAPYASTFVLRQGNGERWLVVDEVDTS